MTALITPPTIIEPFAVNAAAQYITDGGVIPVNSQIGVTNGAASYNDGFPPLTFTPEVSGGVPPFGQDFNALLYTITAHLQNLSAGQLYTYNATISSALGGYPAGSVVKSTNGKTLWLNIVANNTTNPDATDGSAAGWVQLASYGQATITGLTNANVTLNPLQYCCPYIVLSGALTGNISIILPAIFESWLFVNNCTGAFTVTARTASGSGVVIPAGGASSPTGVYCDGVNIQPSVAPLSVPIAVAATPNTLLERNNSGYGFCVYFNQSSALESPAIGSVFVQNTAQDGYLRKVSNANFIAGLSLATTATVSAAIASALTSYFTASQTNSAIASGIATYAATTKIIKAGSFNCINGTVAVAFASAFPTACDAVHVQWEYSGPDVGNVVPGSRTAAGFSYANGNAGACTYIAAGH